MDLFVLRRCARSKEQNGACSDMKSVIGTCRNHFKLYRVRIAGSGHMVLVLIGTGEYMYLDYSGCRYLALALLAGPCRCLAALHAGFNARYSLLRTTSYYLVNH